MVLAKILNNISIFAIILVAIQGHSFCLNNILESYPLQFTNRIMGLSYLILPIISNIYQSSFSSAFTLNPTFSIYLTFYSLIFSFALASIIYIFI